MIVLGLVAFAALRTTVRRRSLPEDEAARHRAARVLVLAVGIQSIHFLEEAATGFHERFPALFGLPSIPLSLFVIVNLALLGIWIASIPGLRAGRTSAFFVAWFLAIAGVLNLVAHPLMAVAVGRYFPGLVSSPFIGGAGIWLGRRLNKATRPK